MLLSSYKTFRYVKFNNILKLYPGIKFCKLTSSQMLMYNTNVVFYFPTNITMLVFKSLTATHINDFRLRVFFLTTLVINRCVFLALSNPTRQCRLKHVVFLTSVVNFFFEQRHEELSEQVFLFSLVIFQYGRPSRWWCEEFQLERHLEIMSHKINI